jgi:hypothetical protein
MVNGSYVRWESKLIQREFNEKKQSWFDTRIRFNEVIDHTSYFNTLGGSSKTSFFELES